MNLKASNDNRARAWLEIDLDALVRNAQRLRARAGVPIIPAVKADAYGLGAIPVARALEATCTPWAFGIATVAEGLELRSAGIQSRLLCLTPVLPGEFATMNTATITPSLHQADDIASWCALSSAPWHLSIDTGMSRAGRPWKQAGELREIVARHPPEGVFTHFLAAKSNDGTHVEQDRRFLQALNDCAVQFANPHVLVHGDNTLAIASRTPSPYHLARPGISLYGWPLERVLQLESVVQMKARVIDLRTIPAGETVSYGGTWTASSERTIATIGVGHGDGYRRDLSNKARVLLRGTWCPVVGIVTMDMTMIDVTGMACDRGDIVTCLGRDGAEELTLGDVAGFGDISPYEFLIGLKLRLPRVYSGSHSVSGEQQ